MNRESIAYYVSDILGWSRPKKFRGSKATKVVNAVTKAITNGLLRGDKVRVDGFGTFYIKRHRPQRFVVTYYYGRKSGPKGVVIHGSRDVVHFRSSPTLKRFVNAGVKDE